MLRKTVIGLILVTMALTLPLLGGSNRSGSAHYGIDLQTRTVADGPHPRVFIYANSVVFQPGNSELPSGVELRANIDPNGNTAPRVFFVYLRNQETGQVWYVDDTGLLDPGVVHAIDGSGPTNFNAIDVTVVQDLILLGPDGIVGPALPIADLDTGNYQLVLDIREGSGQRTIVHGEFGFNVVDQIVEVTSDVTGDVTWSSDNAYFINNRAVFVQNGATLTIQPGTLVLGTGQNSALVVARGGKIIARGTKARPIVMTSTNPVGQRTRGDWGGLILNGRAPINTNEQEGEGGTGLFGGDDPTDSSGELRYVRVEFAGIEFSPDNELNGIAFQGTGSGTLVDYVQVTMNKDDSIEFFGGTTNLKHGIVTRNGDDSLDWVLGWQGKVQFYCAQQSGDDADQGIEADNLSNSNDLTPISNPTIYNATFIGDPSTNPDLSESDIGVLLREGTAGFLRNLIVMGFKESAVDVDDIATVNRINSGTLTFKNSMFFQNCTQPGNGIGCVGGANPADQFSSELDTVINNKEDLAPFTTKAWITGEPTNRYTMDPKLRDPYSLFPPDFRPELNSPALDLRFVAIPPDDGFFDTDVTYIGCVSPTDDWTQGWTYFGF